MNQHFILNGKKLEEIAKERHLTKQDIMYINTQKLKGKLFLGNLRSNLLKGYYKLFQEYNGKKKD